MKRASENEVSRQREDLILESPRTGACFKVEKLVMGMKNKQNGRWELPTKKGYAILLIPTCRIFGLGHHNYLIVSHRSRHDRNLRLNPFTGTSAHRKLLVEDAMRNVPSQHINSKNGW